MALMGKYALAAAAGLLALGACDGGGDGKQTVTIKADVTDDATTTTTTTSDGTARAAATTVNGTTEVKSDTDTGRFKIDAPGFKLDVNVPRSLTGSGNFEMDGAKLYPGSKVRTMEVKADNHENARVHIGFVSPADPATVRGWMIKHFADRGHPLSGNGMALAGTTEEGKPFTLALSPAAAGQTQGEIVIADSKGGSVWSTK